MNIAMPFREKIYHTSDNVFTTMQTRTMFFLASQRSVYMGWNVAVLIIHNESSKKAFTMRKKHPRFPSLIYLKQNDIF